MLSIKNLSAKYINAWCQEWEIANNDRILLLQRYAMEDDDEDLIGFMADLAHEKIVDMARTGRLVTLADILGDFLKRGEWDPSK